MPASVGSIIDAVKLYLQTAFPSTDTGLIGASGGASAVDTAVETLCLLALNNARKFAELKHDWRHSQVRGRVTVPSEGKVALSSVTDYYDALVTFDLKAVTGVYKEDSETGLLTPWPLVTNKALAQEVTDLNDRVNGYDEDYRYRKDLTTDQDARRTQVVVRGDYLHLDPGSSESVSLVVDGYRWMADYTADADTDFFVLHGTTFMMYSAMCEVNHLIKAFVPRTEGNLPPPTRERDEQFGVLLDWDNYSVEGFVNHEFA